MAEDATDGNLEVELVLARPTVQLPGGLQPGFAYWVDPSSPYVVQAFKHGFLVEVKD